MWEKLNVRKIISEEKVEKENISNEDEGRKKVFGRLLSFSFTSTRTTHLQNRVQPGIGFDFPSLLLDLRDPAHNDVPDLALVFGLERGYGDQFVDPLDHAGH